MNATKTLQTDQGLILVTVLLLLLLLTLMGAGAVTTSTTEMGIAGNDYFYKKAFCTAEAGLENVKARLQLEFTHRNQARIAAGCIPDWDFALKGIVPGTSEAQDMTFDAGAVWIKDGILASDERLSFTYTVVAWNNPDDPGGISNDTDGLLCIRSVSVGPRKSTCRIETILRSQISGDPVLGYSAQAGGGPGSSNQGNDIRSISDFSFQ